MTVTVTPSINGDAAAQPPAGTGGGGGGGEGGPKGKPAKDPRYLALRNFAISLSVFNIVGFTVLGFEQPWLWPFLALATGYSVELGLEALSAWGERRAPRYAGRGFRGLYEFLLPAHITSLAVNMLLYANSSWWPVMFGVVVGVAGKHLLKAPINGRWRHYMNPSNFGIAVTLLCFGSWVSISPPYMFTEYANTVFRILIPLLIVTAGTLINAMLTRRIPLIVGWLGGFVIQALVRHWFWDVALFTALGVMSGVAFVLFTNYMVTDPGTTPSKPMNQFVFGSGIAFVYGVLMLFNVVYTLFFATAIVCGLRGALHWGLYAKARWQQRGQPAVVTAAVREQVAQPARAA